MLIANESADAPLINRSTYFLKNIVSILTIHSFYLKMKTLWREFYLKDFVLGLAALFAWWGTDVLLFFLEVEAGCCCCEEPWSVSISVAKTKLASNVWSLSMQKVIGLKHVITSIRTICSFKQTNTLQFSLCESTDQSILIYKIHDHPADTEAIKYFTKYALGLKDLLYKLILIQLIIRKINSKQLCGLKQGTAYSKYNSLSTYLPADSKWIFRGSPVVSPNARIACEDKEKTIFPTTNYYFRLSLAE